MDAVTKTKTHSHRTQARTTMPETRMRRNMDESLHDDDSQAGERPSIGSLDYAYDFVGTGLLIIRT